MPFDQGSYQPPLSVGLQRLLTLADFLETQVPPEHFRMQVWKCGTSACAAGWAATIPSFREAGFECGVMGPSFGEHIGAGPVLMAFFGIDLNDAAMIFAGNYGATPAEKAGEIRTLVARRTELLAERAST